MLLLLKFIKMNSLQLELNYELPNIEFKRLQAWLYYTINI